MVFFSDIFYKFSIRTNPNIANTLLILNAVFKASFTHIYETCKTIVSLNIFYKRSSFFIHVDKLNVIYNKTINRIRFFDNYIDIG